MYQTIRHTHYQKNSDTRSIEEVLNILRKHSVEVIGLNLIKKDWTIEDYEILEWHLVIWCNHTFTDDQLYKILQSETTDSDD